MDEEYRRLLAMTVPVPLCEHWVYFTDPFTWMHLCRSCGAIWPVDGVAPGFEARVLTAAPPVKVPVRQHELTEADKALHHAIGFGLPKDTNRLGAAQYWGEE